MSWEPTSPYGAESMLGEAMEHIYDMEEYADQLKAENAKLRELVEDMLDYGEGAGIGMVEWFADRMRKLGIEVN